MGKEGKRGGNTGPALLQIDEARQVSDVAREGERPAGGEKTAGRKRKRTASGLSSIAAAGERCEKKKGREGGERSSGTCFTPAAGPEVEKLLGKREEVLGYYSTSLSSRGGKASEKKENEAC